MASVRAGLRAPRGCRRWGVSAPTLDVSRLGSWGQPPVPPGRCPRCGGDSHLCSLGPSLERDVYFVCGENYDRCRYSGPIYRTLIEAWASPEVAGPETTEGGA